MGSTSALGYAGHVQSSAQHDTDGLALVATEGLAVAPVRFCSMKSHQQFFLPVV